MGHSEIGLWDWILGEQNTFLHRGLVLLSAIGLAFWVLVLGIVLSNFRNSKSVLAVYRKNGESRREGTELRAFGGGSKSD
jgi:hypothetical protein